MEWSPRRIGGTGFRGGKKGRRYLSLLSPNIRISIHRSPASFAGISTRKATTTMTNPARKTALAALTSEFGALAVIVTLGVAASAVLHLFATRKPK